MYRTLQTLGIFLTAAILLVLFIAADFFILAMAYFRNNPDANLQQFSIQVDISEAISDLGFAPLSATISPTTTPQNAGSSGLARDDQETAATLTATRTPFQPIAQTPTPSLTPTATPTSTSTNTPTNAPTDTPTNIPFTPTSPPTHTSTSQPENPAPQPDPPENVEDVWPPDKASVSGVPGHSMHYRLDCETRSAVDLASFFGFSIDHNEFLTSLPYTDDPETGYVGHYNDPAGSIPPNSYGVHAPPVAELLRQYGVNAAAHRYFSFDQLREEIASGRPVMVWVIGSVQYGTPVEYTAGSTGNTTIVAAYEHTVLVTGYGPSTVTIQDGWNTYQININQFLRSWETLGSQAITVQ
jgi:uncharacterized protein YvpB